MRYVILIYANEESRSIFAGLTPEERAEGLDVYARINADLAASGEMVASAALAAPATGQRVAPLFAPDLPTDGPFAEVKEQLAGFYLVDCADMARALEVAERIPEARLGLVEVRPTMTYEM